jgi:uncharacterized membrane protein YedE/YeeE
VFGYAARRAVALNLAISLITVASALVRHIPERLLERIIVALLVVIGAALIVEAFLPREATALLPEALPARLIAGVLFGLGIGLVSSLLGVAGGELIIPILVFTFGAGIKAAGTASLLVSLPTVAVGALRHRRLGAFDDRGDLTRTVAPMGGGSC